MKTAINCNINILEMGQRWQVENWQYCRHPIKKALHTTDAPLSSHCKRQAAVMIDGEILCKQHAGEKLLNMAIEAAENDR